MNSLRRARVLIIGIVIAPLALLISIGVSHREAVRVLDTQASTSGSGGQDPIASARAARCSLLEQALVEQQPDPMPILNAFAAAAITAPLRSTEVALSLKVRANLAVLWPTVASGASRVTHVWIAYDPYTDGTTFYGQLDVGPSESLEAFSQRLSANLNSVLVSQRESASPTDSATIDSILQRIAVGDLPVVAIRMAGPAHDIGTALIALRASIHNVTESANATPLLPPDSASLRVVEEACQ